MDFASDFLPWRSPRNIISILTVGILACVCLCNAVFIIRLKYRKEEWKVTGSDSHHQLEKEAELNDNPDNFIPRSVSAYTQDGPRRGSCISMIKKIVSPDYDDNSSRASSANTIVKSLVVKANVRDCRSDSRSFKNLRPQSYNMALSTSSPQLNRLTCNGNATDQPSIYVNKQTLGSDLHMSINSHGGSTTGTRATGIRRVSKQFSKCLLPGNHGNSSSSKHLDMKRRKSGESFIEECSRTYYSDTPIARKFEAERKLLKNEQTLKDLLSKGDYDEGQATNLIEKYTEVIASVNKDFIDCDWKEYVAKANSRIGKIYHCMLKNDRKAKQYYDKCLDIATCECRSHSWYGEALIASCNIAIKTDYKGNIKIITDGKRSKQSNI
ncbi:uncharacterized protein TRIADDRAFT_58230 [Trichoplax adhaerens]|uniref:Uncharacterized protein n=1 Tax=Trichoplax adhaerens TaxID=10228 RepID=B3S180_TRIAD|nr:predicted protein [Trichoplax adhaerens]EDV23195.1 predicted protein [Trichoplax adhaerens]|eukprot:XP_002114105.1 predicted protein [Trichoplax adhaerens]